MTGFVQQGANIVVDADGVHEDERLLSKRESLAVRARRLSLAVLEVEELRVDHRLVVTTEV